MILFGSYARGNARDFSDIDVAVISDDFRGNALEDGLTLDRVAREINPLIEAFPYRTSDLKKCRRGDFLSEIIRTGRMVSK